MSDQPPYNPMPFFGDLLRPCVPDDCTFRPGPYTELGSGPLEPETPLDRAVDILTQAGLINADHDVMEQYRTHMLKVGTEPGDERIIMDKAVSEKQTCIRLYTGHLVDPWDL